MKVKGFGAWPSRNSLIGGQRRSYDEINQSAKGEERFPRAEEYASRNVEEYHHYDEQQDLTKEQDDQKKRQKEKDARSRRMRRIQQVMALVVGSVIIATSYNAMAAKRNAAQAAGSDDAVVDTAPDDSGNGQEGNGNGATTDQAATQPAETVAPTQAPTNGGSSAASSGSASGSSGSGSGASTTAEGYAISWIWNEDGTVTMVLTDSSGNFISEVAATVTTSEDPAGCNTEGTVTRTASAAYNGQTYTDTRYDTLPALGHSFDSGTEITLSDGSTATDFECTRCHEHFIIKNSVSEE